MQEEKQNRYRQLAEKWLNGTITEAEKQEFMEWYRSADDELPVHIPLAVAGSEEEHRDKLLSAIRQKIKSEEASVVAMPKKRNWWWAAAAVLFLCAGSYYFLTQRDRAGSGPDVRDEPLVKSISAPDRSRATISLADGKIIYLDEAGSGQLALEGNSKIVRNADGGLVYEQAAVAGGEPMIYNTLYNPRGSQVTALTLADGSRVWLNAGSSLTYPVAFAANERRVKITGEAYFEIAHNAASPFYVANSDMQVKVLGTHFNVNAYEDESAVRVTLLEGSVAVNRRSSAVMLKPGEQAVARTAGPGQAEGPLLTISRSPDLDGVLAWKNGLFHLKGVTLKELMRQVSRWYDVDIAIAEDIGELDFYGIVGRKENLLQLLSIMEATGKVKFRVDGRKISVQKGEK